MGRLRSNPNSKKEILNYQNYYQGEKGKYFDNSYPIYLEIGSGKGNFIIQNALTFKDINFIAYEKYPTVILKTLKKIKNLSEPISNLKIICDDAKNLLDYFTINSISKIFLNFSDP